MRCEFINHFRTHSSRPLEGLHTYVEALRRDGPFSGVIGYYSCFLPITLGLMPRNAVLAKGKSYGKTYSCTVATTP